MPNAASDSNTAIENLRVEYTKNPMGLECDSPRFGWQMTNSSERNVEQKSYRIMVASSSQNLQNQEYDMWDSGKIDSGESVDISYEGKELEACKRYYWQVMVWDNKGGSISSTEEAYFETGLCDTGWDNAQWIQKNELDDGGITSYTIDLDFIIDSANAGIAFGAKDSNNFFMWQVNSYDFRASKAVYLRPHIKQSGNWTVLPPTSGGFGPEVNITSAIGYDSDNVIGKSVHMQIAVDNGVIKTYFNNSQEPVSTYNYGSVIPLEKIAFRHNTDHNATEIARYDNLVIKDKTGSILYENDFSDANSTGFVGGTWKDGMLQVGQQTTGEVFVLQETAVVTEGSSAPMLRKEFSCNSQIESARIYATAAGLYELYLNGKRVGEDYFNPGWTDYTKRLMYQTFDVTEYLQSGENVLAAILGKGWYCGNIAHVGENRYGTEPALMAKLVVNYTDGSTKTTVVTDNSWTCNTNGPITDNNFLDGEKYDASKEIPGWNAPGYVENSKWKPVKVTTAAKLKIADSPEAQIGETVQQVAELTVKAVTEPKSKAFIYDFGQNFAGVVKLELPASFTTTHKGVTIRLRHGEMLNDASGTGDDVEGSLYDANLRTFKAIDTYTVKGDANGETYTPRFTYHGFRYVEITGLDEALPASYLTGVVLSNALETTGSIQTSNALVNQLYSNAYWGLLSNFISVPTDCPQRNERMGWAGDAQIFTRTATYFKNANLFYQKYLGDMRTSQRNDGAYADIAPALNIHETYLHNGWGDAGVIIPWQIYQQYGDTQVIRDHYASMKAWVDALYKSTNGTYIRQDNTGYGDWLGVESTSPSLTDTGFFIYSCELFSKMAKAIDRSDDADYYADMAQQAKQAWKNRFQNADGTIKETTQTACIVALQFNIVEDENDRAKIAKQLVDNIKAHDYHLTVGFVGVSYLCPVLSEMGYSDVAYALLQQETYPSWLYSVNQGATTIWERWNSYTKDNGFGPVSMNSFNHYSYGAIVEWMYRYMLGIERDENNVGYKHFILQPQLGGTITSVSGYFDTVYGRINSSWSIEDDSFTYSATVPANTMATLYLPILGDGSVTESGVLAENSEGVRFVGVEKNNNVYELASGSYTFVWNAHTHDLKKVAAKDPSCTEAGNREYYKCSECNKLFADANGTTELTEEEVKIQASGHSPSAEWKNDGTNHWHECANCGLVIDDSKSSHDYDNDEDTTCNTCGYVRTITPAAHTHTYGTEWEKDKDCHWHECTDENCADTANSVKDKQAHTYGEWTETKAPTEKEAGEKEHTCTVCGYKETAEIPVTVVSKPDDSEPIQTGDNSQMVLWIALLFVGGVGVGGTILYRKRKNRR